MKTFGVYKIILPIIPVIVFLVFLSIAYSAENISYVDCNKPNQVNTKKILEKFGASADAWKCFEQKLNTCTPAKIYGQMKTKASTNKIYFSVFGKDENGDCVVTGPFYINETDTIIGRSCLLNEQLQNSGQDAFSLLYKVVFKAQTGQCVSTIDQSYTGAPFCMLNTSNPDLTKCNKYIDLDKYRDPPATMKYKLLTEKEINDLPADVITKYADFTPFQYTYQDLVKHIYEDTAANTLIHSARLGKVEANNSLRMNLVNTKEEAVKILKKNNVPKKIDEIMSSDKKSLTDAIDIYVSRVNRLSDGKQRLLLKNNGVGGANGIKYKNVYSFVIRGVWLEEGSVCLDKGMAVINGYVNSGGDVVYLGWYCLDNKNVKSNLTGYIWKDEVFQQAIK